MNWYLKAIKQYTVFKGRARRKEYWMFGLFNIIALFIAGLIDVFVKTYGIIGIIYSLAVIIPAIAVSIRRLHDTDRSGWWILISFIPVIGVLILFVFLLKDSNPGQNQYGENPKEIMA